MTTSVDYYKVLGIPETASQSEIEAAYKALVSIWHPQHFVGASPDDIVFAETRFQEISEAFRVLSDPTTREQYDGQRPHKKASTSSSDSKKLTHPRRWTTWLEGIGVAILIALGHQMCDRDSSFVKSIKKEFSARPKVPYSRQLPITQGLLSGGELIQKSMGMSSSKPGSTNLNFPSTSLSGKSIKSGQFQLNTKSYINPDAQIPKNQWTPSPSEWSVLDRTTPSIKKGQTEIQVPKIEIPKDLPEEK